MSENAQAKLSRLKQKVKTLLGRGSSDPRLKTFHESDETKLSNDELRAFMRHDAHRIEKAFYNKIFASKREFYDQRRQNVYRSVSLLRERGEDVGERTTVWAAEIADGFAELESRFIEPKSTRPQTISLEDCERYMDLVRTRRSTRVWAADQPPAAVLTEFARTMIEAASWAPSSGNRQPIRYKIVVDPEQKRTLAGLKEEHCYAAPCLIFVGVDRRFYGGLGENEAGVYIDAGAAAMQMVLAAHAAHYGVCWNHFATDLIASRKKNEEIYARFTTEQNIPDYIEPIAIIAFGVADFHPPVPARVSVEDLLLRDK